MKPAPTKSQVQKPSIPERGETDIEELKYFLHHILCIYSYSNDHLIQPIDQTFFHVNSKVSICHLLVISIVQFKQKSFVNAGSFLTEEIKSSSDTEEKEQISTQFYSNKSADEDM